MPVIRVELLAGRSRDQKREMAEAFTRDMARIAKVSPASIQVVFTDVAKSDWAVGGVLNDEPAKV
jgi:4-oxalocrotonate tautomerase